MVRQRRNRDRAEAHLSATVPTLCNGQVASVPMVLRHETLIEAGAIGNDKPIRVVNERWYSNELLTTLMTKHIDPRSGQLGIIATSE